MTAIVLFHKRTSANQRNAEDLEIIWTNEGRVHERALAWGRLRLAFDQEIRLPAFGWVQRNADDNACRLDAGNIAHFLQQTFAEQGELFLRGIFPGEQIESETQYALLNETGVHLLKMMEAAHEQSRAGQQQES